MGQFKKKIDIRTLWTNLIILTGLFVLTFIFMCQSPLNILLLNGNSGTDSSVFRTIGLQMKKGLMPYKDSFDHKGPLIYIYNYLGVLIRQDRGIWIIEFISAFVTFYFMYRIAVLKCGKIQAFSVLAICIAPLYAYFEGGNLTEEYAMPFIAMTIYIFMDYFLYGKITKTRLIFCGVGFGAVCMLRINMIAVWIVFCCGVLLQDIIVGQMREIFRYLLWFLVGSGIIIFPICFWLLINGAFMDFVDDYFVFNIMYTDVTLLDKYISLSSFISNTYVLIAIIVTCCMRSEKRLFRMAYLTYEIVGLLLVCVSGRTYAHYGMVFVPMLVYPFSTLLSKQFVKKKPWIYAIVICFSVELVIPTWIGGVNRVAEYGLSENKTRARTDTVGKVCDYVKRSSDRDDKIIVWGNWNIIYVLSQRLPASKYSYQSPIDNVDGKIISDFFEEIRDTAPKFIIIQKGNQLGRMKSFINENGYVCTSEIDGVAVYMQDF